MNVNLQLVVLHMNYDNGFYRCLLDDNKIISITLTNPDIIMELKKMMIDYLDINPEWVSFSLVDVEGGDNITITYTCMIPSILENFKGEWMDIGEINGINRTLVLKASQKII